MRIDLTGRKFNMLTVLRRPEPRNGKWLCQCDCGVYKAVDATRLRNGGIKSCGCRPRFIDLAGHKFGNRIAIRKSPNWEYGEMLWECLCDCGKVSDVPSSRLRLGKSVGCLSCRKRKRPFESLYNTFHSGSLARNIRIAVTFEQFLGFVKIGECHYCGATVNWAEHVTDKHHNQPYNLDRKDNDKGYTLDNVVVCCARCNRGKSKYFSYEEWVEVGKILRVFRERKLGFGAGA